MKKSTLLFLVSVSVLLNSCGAVKGLMTYSTDPSLPNLQNIHALSTFNSIGFEWDKITTQNIHGINVYRGNKYGDTGSFKHIGTIGNRYATHFVDTHVKSNETYSYRFATFSFGLESSWSKIFLVKTREKFPAVSFVQAYKEDSGIVKLLWKPHPDHGVNRYTIQRSVDGGKWYFIAQVEGRLMVEYIDTFVRSGHTYRYRIVAQSYDEVEALPSQTTQITL